MKSRHWDHNGGYWRLGKHHGPSVVRGHPTRLRTLRMFTRAKHG
jgi:hypothetical protein